MYDVVDYGKMIADLRTAAYAQALATRITPDSVVLDIGSGLGIMALLACRAGAAKVYALEPSDVIQVAREIAAANGFGDRIHFLQAMSTDIDLPEKVDGMVCDLHGVLPLYGTSVVSILDARERFLKPGGWLIPCRETMWTAVVSSETQLQPFLKPWETEFGFDFSKARAKSVNTWRRSLLNAEDLLVEPRCWGTLDYATLASSNLSGEAAWTLDHAADGYGLAVWFESETVPGVGFSNSPLSANRPAVYQQAFFPWPARTALAAGNRVHVSIRADFVDADYIWGWSTCVTGRDAGPVRASYRQSSLLGTPFSNTRLRKRDHLFVPEPDDKAAVDRYILELMGQRLTLGEISKRALGAFPSQLKDWDTALSRVGSISARYSK